VYKKRAGNSGESVVRRYFDWAIFYYGSQARDVLGLEIVF
jgi:hypothetical protein